MNSGRSISSTSMAGIAISMSSAEKGMLQQKIKVKTKESQMAAV